MSAHDTPTTDAHHGDHDATPTSSSTTRVDTERGSVTGDRQTAAYASMRLTMSRLS